MEKEEAEYCEVCGNPLTKGMPDAPNAGRDLLNCKVKGKIVAWNAKNLLTSIALLSTATSDDQQQYRIADR